MIFFTSDLHLDHYNVINYCKRPFSSVEEMNEQLVFNWNSRVKPDDTIYCVGDFSLSRKALRFVPRLNGVKILVAGNHDWVFPGHKKYINDTGKYLDAGFNRIEHRSLEIEVNDSVWNVCHFPYRQNPVPEGYDARYWEFRLDDDGRWLLHGHIHGIWKKRGRMIDVGVDSHNYFPVSIDEIEDIMLGVSDG